MTSIIRRLNTVFSGTPWYGQPVLNVLESIHDVDVYQTPYNGGHSLIELLYHMINWTNFVLKRIEKDPVQDVRYFEQHDWITIDPAKHTWEKGMEALKASQQRLIDLLGQQDDELLREIVDERKYNYKFMLHGLADHYIYHLGQMAYLKKWLEK